MVGVGEHIDADVLEPGCSALERVCMSRGGRGVVGSGCVLERGADGVRFWL